MLQFAEDYDESTSATKLLLIPDHIREANKPQIDMLDRLNITFKTATYGTLNNFIELGKWSGLASEDAKMLSRCDRSYLAEIRALSKRSR